MKTNNLKIVGICTLGVIILLAGIITVLELTSSYKTSTTIHIKAPVITRKSILINAPVNKVWAAFSNVDQWSSWQKQIPIAKINGDFKKGSTFSWKSGGLTIKSTLLLVDENKSIAWCGPAFGSFAIHTWHFNEENGQTKVYVEESMEGWLVSLLSNQFQSGLDKSIDYWLAALKAKSETFE